MDRFEAKLLKIIFNSKEGYELNIDESKLHYADRLTLMDYYHNGVLVYNKRKRFIVSNEFKSYKGKVVRVKDKFAFVYVEELDEDYYVGKDYLNNALIDDEVLIRIFPISQKGVIEKVTKHAHESVVGVLSYKNGVHVKPTDKNLNFDILIEENSIIGLPSDIVLVKMTSFNPYKGIIEKVIGNKNNIGIDVLTKILEHDVPVEFSNDTLKEVEKIPSRVRVSQKMKEERVDLRDELIVTIDGDDAKDFDDAISVKIGEDGYYHLGVHIADVTHYVKKNSALDKDALNRGTSCYLVDRVVPMLPFELSNGICSLNPDVDRLTMSCFMVIDENGKVISYDIKESIIHSKYRLTYKNVNKLFNHEMKMDKELSEMLFLAKRLAGKIRKEREGRGAIDLDIDEAKLLVDKEGKVYDIVKRERGISEMMIEDFMIAANESIASYVYYLDLPFIYRIHEEPSMKKLSELKSIITPLGYRLSTVNGIHAQDFQKILDKCQETSERHIIRQMILRSLAKARYHNENLGHFGLGSDCYTHFTSPIRRYPDLLVHRLLKYYIKSDVTKINYEALKEEIGEIADSTSKCERRAMNLERDVEAMKMAEYMEDKIGEKFLGTVSGMIDSGFFVELDNTIEGMVRFENIHSDFYIFDSKRMVCFGRASKKQIHLGDSIEVEVVNASKETGKIEFQISGDYFKKAKFSENKFKKKKR